MADEQERAAAFIARWAASGASERANYQGFLKELCALLDVPQPDPATDADDAYVFEKPVKTTYADGSSRTGFIDLYKRGCFVLEAKQSAKRAEKPADPAQAALFEAKPAPKKSGSVSRAAPGFDSVMWAAKGQAEGYAKALPAAHGWPPFLIVVDIGHLIDVYADFSLIGKAYAPFPAPGAHRLKLADLLKPEIRARLKAIWTDPLSLDTSREAARVTRKIAAHLSELAKSYQGGPFDSETVARFLMRCLFTMFAEDVRLLPPESFKELLRSLRGQPENFVSDVEELWSRMNEGGRSHVLRKQVMRFNGGLFKEARALPVRPEQLGLLIEAAEADWSQVEPAIFGTLLERALSDKDRHKLGAHYTPRAYVERLVRPVLMEPLREEWALVQAGALKLSNEGKLGEARAELTGFHQRLCALRVLDPACGSGNFLYVALEEMKRLEGEVNELRAQLGGAQGLALEDATVSPRQFLGIEINPWAAAVAELVLWIGSLQQHFRLKGDAMPAEPILRDFGNIERRDAVLSHEAPRPRLAASGEPVTRWDGTTTMINPVTGEAVPDPAARAAVLDYPKARPADWPQADVIIGNPPFIGAKYLREALGDGYVEALWSAWPHMPPSADFVMYWWDKAASLARSGQIARFGFVTTNSLRQSFNRKVLEPHLNDPKSPLSLIFAIPDHPWVDAADGAAVRIAMTAAEAGASEGLLQNVIAEDRERLENEGIPVTLASARGKIFSNLQIGSDLTALKPLRANEGLSSPGVKLHGAGFIVSRTEAKPLGLGRIPGLEAHIRPYLNGKDIAQASRDAMVIDLFGLSEKEVLTRFPEVWQHVFDKVKPERDQNNRESYKKNWWIFGEPRRDIRSALAGLPRYIVTLATSKHRFFTFLSEEYISDDALIMIASADAAHLAILSSRIHVVWALATGGTLEDRPRYNKSKCFDPFPFPPLAPERRAALADLGERLDAHRKARRALHPKLTLTEMYNALAALKAGERLEGRTLEIYEQGAVGVLRRLHDEIDRETAAAYGWPEAMADEEILSRLAGLNAARAAAEDQGEIHWLRPDYQNPAGGQTGQFSADLGVSGPAAAGARAWPKETLARLNALSDVLRAAGSPLTAQQAAAAFVKARKADVSDALDTLAAFGRAVRLEDGRYAAA